MEEKNYFVRTTSSKFDDAKENNKEALFIYVHDESDVDELYVNATKDENEIDFRRIGGDTYIVSDECKLDIGSLNPEIKSTSVGNLGETSLGDLNGKPVNEILLDILKPGKKNPTKTSSPSVSLTYSGDKLISVGSTLPVEDDFNVSTNLGKWSDGSSVAGSCETSKTMTPEKWGEASEEQIYVIKAVGNFTEGDVPKNNYNESISDLQYKGGVVNSNEIKIVSVLPIYINDDEENILVMKEHLVDYNSTQTINVQIPKEIDGTLDKFKVYLPYAFNTFTVNQFNPMTGKYDIPIIMELMEGETSKYVRTKDVNDTTTGSAKYEIKIKK